MSDRLRIHLLRHPPPAVAEGICYGQSDLGLALPAASAAERLHALLPERYGVISSPLRRCRELATALSADHRIDPRLQEIHFGDWEGRAWNDIPRADLDAWAAAPFDHTPPGGESATAMAARVVAFAADLTPAPAPAAPEWVLVSHQGPLRVLLAYWLELPRECWFNFHFDFAGSTCIELSAGGGRLLWLNR